MKVTENNEKALKTLTELFAFETNGIIDIKESENYDALSLALSALRERIEQQKYGDELESRLDCICNCYCIGYSDSLFLRELLRVYEDENEHENSKSLPTDNAEIGKWPVKIGDTICGAKIVGADYANKTVTIKWEESHEK